MVYTHEDRTKDFKWFLSVYDDLYQKYGHKFLAVRNKEILGVYDDRETALDRTSEIFGMDTFSVWENTGDKVSYIRSMPSSVSVSCGKQAYIPAAKASGIRGIHVGDKN